MAGIPPDDFRFAQGSPERLGAGRRNDFVRPALSIRIRRPRSRRHRSPDRLGDSSSMSDSLCRPRPSSFRAAFPDRGLPRPLRRCRRRPGSGKCFASAVRPTRPAPPVMPPRLMPMMPSRSASIFVRLAQPGRRLANVEHGLRHAPHRLIGIERDHAGRRVGLPPGP